MTNSYTKL